MEKRIRTIWTLSLASALLLIGVQGYWLYNQYQHVANAYTLELADKVLAVCEKEYKLRKKEVESSYVYYINKKIEMMSDSLGENVLNRQLQFSISDIKSNEVKIDTLSLGADDILRKAYFLKDNWCPLKDSLTSEKMSFLEKQEGDSNTPVDDNVALFKLQMNASASEENMHIGIDRAVTNFNNPFQKETLDSLLSVDMSGVDYSIILQHISDSAVFSSWQLTGNLYSSSIDILYAYSPFEGKGVVIRIPIPSQPLFERMVIQLMISLGLILLLIGCLVLQIKTILKQKKINEMREGFVNTMVHELKRPVQTLKTFISFLGNREMRSDETMTEQIVQDSMFELDNLSAYLQKLKDMIRADNDVMSLRISRFDLRELIEKIIRLIHHPTGKEVKISTCYDMETGWIEADRIHVANVINNLIENAIKYSGEQVEIVIKAQLKGKELRLTVSDNGIGIPHSEQERVFAKFYRGKNLPDKNIPGIGLGLSYVKLIAEAHNGHISLLSDSGKGTSVTLYLPQ